MAVRNLIVHGLAFGKSWLVTHGLGDFGTDIGTATLAHAATGSATLTEAARNSATITHAARGSVTLTEEVV